MTVQRNTRLCFGIPIKTSLDSSHLQLTSLKCEKNTAVYFMVEHQLLVFYLLYG